MDESRVIYELLKSNMVLNQLTFVSSLQEGTVAEK